MRTISKIYLLLPLALIPLVARLWDGHFLMAAYCGLLLLWLFHPSGARDWWAQVRLASRDAPRSKRLSGLHFWLWGVPRRTTFQKVVVGIWLVLTLLILFREILRRALE